MTSDPSPFREVWLEAHDGQRLCAMIHGDVGWLMYLREDGDAGFTSRNADYAGPAGALVEFRSTNGQMDEYPRAWVYPRETIERALEYFRRKNAPPPFIAWHGGRGGGGGRRRG